MTTESGTRPILLVEDNPMDVDLTLRAFAKRKLANRIDVARDGEEALAYVGKWKTGDDLPVVILLDLKLPEGAAGWTSCATSRPIPTFAPSRWWF